MSTHDNWFLHNGCVNVLIRVYPGTQTPLAWPAKKVVRHDVTFYSRKRLVFFWGGLGPAEKKKLF